MHCDVIRLILTLQDGRHYHECTSSSNIINKWQGSPPREVENNSGGGKNHSEIDQINNVDGESYSEPCCCTMFEYIV